jgi:hypothetical protein
MSGSLWKGSPVFDDLLDLFDRDRARRSGSRTSQRGLRGMLARLMSDHDDDRRSSRRYDDRDGFEADSDDFDLDRSSRRRRHDRFDPHD